MRKPRQYRGGYQSSRLKDFAQAERKKPTDAESLLWQLLRRRQLCGFKFRRQHQFGDYLADFFCNEAKLVVECDGPIHEANERWHHDQMRDAYMASQGLRVLRFTNEQVLNETARVLREIENSLPVKQ